VRLNCAALPPSSRRASCSAREGARSPARCATARAVRGGRRRHAVPRRDRRHAAALQAKLLRVLEDAAR
jgi:hypothetical protein